MIYIISNRAVVEDDGKKKFKNDGKEHALPVFRIAECQINGENVDYNILEDDFPEDYRHLIPILRLKEGTEEKVERESSLKGSSQMFYRLYKDMLADEEKKCNVLFFITGFGNSFKKNKKQIYELYKLYVEPKDTPIAHLVFLSWPSRNHPILTYWSDQRDAEVTGKVFARLYEKLQSFFFQMFEMTNMDRCHNKIHLAVSSMGTQVLQSMLEEIPERKLYPLWEEVFLLHSDVKNNVFESGKPFTKLEQMAERTHIYINKSDDGLLTSTITKNFNKRLGRRGPSKKTDLNNETFVVDCSKTKAVGIGEKLFDHAGFLYRPTEIEDIKAVLRGEDQEEIINRKEHKRKDGYFLLEKSATA